MRYEVEVTIDDKPQSFIVSVPPNTPIEEVFRIADIEVSARNQGVHVEYRLKVSQTLY
jgi:hypothetical protein